MSKRRIGFLKGKPIVEGDSNEIAKNEINIKNLQGNNKENNNSDIYSYYLFVGNEMNTGE